MLIKISRCKICIHSFWTCFFWLDRIRLMSDVDLESPSWVSFNQVHCWWRVLYSFAEGTWKGVNMWSANAWLLVRPQLHCKNMLQPLGSSVAHWIKGWMCKELFEIWLLCSFEALGDADGSDYSSNVDSRGRPLWKRAVSLLCSADHLHFRVPLLGSSAGAVWFLGFVSCFVCQDG